MSGVVVWFVGLPSSGKSTLARAVREQLNDRGSRSCILDGDEVRGALRPAPGYSAAERADFYATLAGLAAMLARQGLIVLVPATANLRRYRERARGLAPRFIEVFVDTPADIREQRDTKGLYARARGGEITGLPGLDAAFEAPLKPDLVVSGADEAGADAQVSRIVELIRSS